MTRRQQRGGEPRESEEEGEAERTEENKGRAWATGLEWKE